MLVFHPFNGNRFGKTIKCRYTRFHILFCVETEFFSVSCPHNLGQPTQFAGFKIPRPEQTRPDPHCIHIIESHHNKFIHHNGVFTGLNVI